MNHPARILRTPAAFLFGALILSGQLDHLFLQFDQPVIRIKAVDGWCVCWNFFNHWSARNFT